MLIILISFYFSSSSRLMSYRHLKLGASAVLQILVLYPCSTLACSYKMGNLRAILEYVLIISLYLTITEFSCTNKTVHGILLLSLLVCLLFKQKLPPSLASTGLHYLPDTTQTSSSSILALLLSYCGIKSFILIKPLF